MTISLDGFVAGAVQTREDPIGEGHRLHQWMFRADEPGHEADARLREQIVGGRGAFIMGRNMYGPIRGEWGDEDWRGWWGEDPPYHAPVFVLTHYPHAPIEMKGGTTFHFVTDGFDAALAQARAVAGDAPVDIAGGAATVRQALTAGVIGELVLDVVPILLGAGERIFDGVPDPGLTPVEVIPSPLATHIRYRVGHG
ncbi:MAG: dihydrofolate reductase family protein [Streptosporangiaceae bacterium]